MSDVVSEEERAYRRAVRFVAMAILGIAVASIPIGYLVAGAAGAWGALAGTFVAAVGALPTPLAMLIGHRRPPQALAGIVAFTWLGKMAVLVVTLLVLQGVDQLNRPTFAVVAAAGIVAALVIDVTMVRKARIPYVDPGT